MAPVAFGVFLVLGTAGAAIGAVGGLVLGAGLFGTLPGYAAAAAGFFGGALYGAKLTFPVTDAIAHGIGAVEGLAHSIRQEGLAGGTKHFLANMRSLSKQFKASRAKGLDVFSDAPTEPIETVEQPLPPKGELKKDFAQSAPRSLLSAQVRHTPIPPRPRDWQP